MQNLLAQQVSMVFVGAQQSSALVTIIATNRDVGLDDNLCMPPGSKVFDISWVKDYDPKQVARSFFSVHHMLLGDLTMLVKDHMARNPITATPETTHKQAAELMREHGIHHLPILDREGKLVGIVVEEDLLAAQPSPATTLSIYEIHGLLSKLQIKEIMSHPVHTTTPDCPLEEAARQMLSDDVGCLPVMEKGRLVGTITDTDIFEALVTLLGGGRDGARFTLHLPDKPGMLAQVAQTVAEAGGNIISVTSWRSKEDSKAYITIKEQGASYVTLKAMLDELEDVEVVDLREKPNVIAG